MKTFILKLDYKCNFSSKLQGFNCTLATHLSIPFVARIRRGVGSKYSMSFLSLVSLVFFFVSEWEQGSQDSPISFDMQILEIGSWNTVRSNDMNPINISSEKEQIVIFILQSSNIKMEKLTRITQLTKYLL
jgi:hypothetical protein